MTKEKWLDLIISDNEKDRDLAFVCAIEIKEEIQNELLLWYLEDTNCIIRNKIYWLLNERSRKRLFLNENPSPQNVLDKSMELKIINSIDDEILREVIVDCLVGFKKKDLFPKSKLVWIIANYKIRKGCTLNESRVIIEPLIASFPGYNDFIK